MMQSASQGEGHLSMQQSGKRVDRATLLLSLGAVVTFTGASLTLAQDSPPAPSTHASRLRLPATCLQQRRASEKIVTLLGIVAQHPTAGAYNTLGVLYAQADRAQCAVAAFENALKLEDENWEVHYNFALALLREGQRAKALKELQTAIQQKPDAVSAHFALATPFETAQEASEAQTELRAAALNLDPKFLPAARKLSEVLFAEGKPQAAVAVLQDALKQAPADYDQEARIAKLNEQANRSMAQGDAKSASENYRKAVELKPNDARLRYNLALALNRLGDQAAERKELVKAVSLDPNMAVAQNQLGLLALGTAQFAEAENRFKKALAIDPKYAEAESNLGALYGEEGKNAEALALLQRATQDDPSYVTAHVNLGLLLAQQGDYTGAQREFQMAIQVDPSYGPAYSALGMLQAKTGRGADAVKSFERAVVLEPASAEAHLNLGIALVDQFDRPTGFKEFSEAARLDPNLAAAHYNLGRFLFETGKYDDASRELETAVRLQPDSADAVYFLALTRKQENDPDRSTDLLRKVVALQPDNANAQYLLGQNLEHAGDRAGAIQHWKAAVQADPNHTQALYNLARSLAKMNDPEAQQYQHRFDDLQRKQLITDRAAELGNFALEAANAQNWPKAMEQMNEAIRLCGSCAESAHLHKNLGLFYGRIGNLDEAEKELHTALALAPGDADAKSALATFEGIRKAQSK
jgi:tetratricopeptide (TPR) repeat protein